MMNLLIWRLPFVETLALIIFPAVRLDEADARETLVQRHHERLGLLFLLAAGFAHLPADHCDRHDAERKDEERPEGVERIHHRDHEDDREDRDGMLDQRTEELAPGVGGGAGLVRHRLDQLALLHRVVKREGLAHQAR
jgi:hypothetical protein